MAATPNQFLPISSAGKFFRLLTLSLLLVNAYVANAQVNTNSSNSNTSNTNVNANRNSNANANTNANANANQTGQANDNVNVNSNQKGSGASPDPRADDRKDNLAKAWWFVILVTLMFGALLFPFAMTITRAIRFSPSTFRSPLGLPEGSLRAMLAYTLVVFLGFYIYASILSFSDFPPPQFLLGIVATVIGFYFGSRTGESSGAATQKTGTVQGTVTDKNEAPAAGANVELSQSDGKKVTQKADAKGKYKFDNVMAGDYNIQASLEPHAPSEPMKVKVTAGEPLTVDLKLK